jgi:hypothetical protein
MSSGGGRADWVRQQSRAVGESLGIPPSIRNAALRKHGGTMFQQRFGPLLAAP